MPGLELTPQLHAIFSTLVEERTGLSYGREQRELFADKLAARAADAGFDSLLDYYYYLRYDAAGSAEIDALIDALVVNETYFFRELDSLETVVDEIVAPAVAEGRRARVWSAAASTGEEPLTLAVLLAERGLLDRVELIASDISLRALARAKTGAFNRRALRAPVPSRFNRWLTESDGRVQVDPAIVAAVSWRRVNLVVPGEVESLVGGRPLDLILCRNVLIYFRDEVTLRVVSTLTSALRPGGALVVGVSESLLRFGTSLLCEERHGVFLYRRPE